MNCLVIADCPIWRNRPVQDAVEALAAAEPDSPLAHLLLARWELRLDMNASLAESVERLTRAIAHYHNAAEPAPQDPVPRFELYERTILSKPLRLSDGIPMLGEAYRRAPGNLWVMKEWLIAQAKDPAIRETIAAAGARASLAAEHQRRMEVPG